MSRYRYDDDLDEGLRLLWKLWTYFIVLILLPVWLLGRLHRRIREENTRPRL